MSEAPNPRAPKPSPSAQDFAFLIGTWRCEARIKTPTGDWQPYIVEWQGRYILDGRAIADEYRMTTLSGELIVLGCNFRTYNPATNTWTIKWLNALTGTWTDLVSEELGGVQIAANSITYAFREPTSAHPYTRATYTSHSPTHFTWNGDQSTDAKTWTDFMLVDCYRNE
ncbi:MAG: hypothetical protein WBY53_14570 [Acidobacteriaceae bacterium]